MPDSILCTEEGGAKGRDTMVVLGDLIDWSARKNMNVKQSHIIKYKSKHTLDWGDVGVISNTLLK